jgi:glutathione S-transferase
VIIEKGLESRVEIILAQTRLASSPYYHINPSGRVPYLMRDDGVALEESALICAYLDQLDGKPIFNLPAGEQVWEARRLEALARSLMDCLAVWGREIDGQNERSPTIINTKPAQRAHGRLWEKRSTIRGCGPSTWRRSRWPVPGSMRAIRIFSGGRNPKPVTGLT